MGRASRLGRGTPGTATLVAALVLAATSPAPAQRPDASPSPGGGLKWTLLDAVGFGGIGFGLGLAATWDMEGEGIGPPESALAVVGGTTAAGIVAGAFIGRRAQHGIGEGRPVGGAHRAAVLGGVVAAGAVLGALGAIPLVNGEGEGTPLGSDEQTVLLTTLAGGGLGALYAWKHSDELSGGSLRVTPAVSKATGYGVRIRTSF